MESLTSSIVDVVKNDLTGLRKGDKYLSSIITNAFTNLASKDQFVNQETKVSPLNTSNHRCKKIVDACIIRKLIMGNNTGTSVLRFNTHLILDIFCQSFNVTINGFTRLYKTKLTHLLTIKCYLIFIG